MNVTELARRLRVHPAELLEKLPLLGFDVGRRAIKIDDRTVPKIMAKWSEMSKRERLKAKYAQEEAVKKDAVARVKSVTLPKLISVRDFAAKLSLPLNVCIGELMKNGILASVNEQIDRDTASIVAEDLGYRVENEGQEENAEKAASMSAEQLKEMIGREEEGNLKPRPPVVVVMGHVDHGKTALLDAIRKTNVIATESGGITQHIGAYQVERKGRKVTFIDTPGHEAFTIMRSRGARVADIAILVVAADDGVQPQTVEVIKIIDAAKLPFVVALNKMDRPDVDLHHVKTQLSENNLIPEEWGGKTVIAPVSAKNGTGIDDLLETVLLVADMNREKIVANPDRSAVGTIVESHVDSGEGPVATVLVQAGTLNRNDLLAIGDSAYGRVRAMKDWQGRTVPEATPGMPVRVLGFKVAPQVGDIVEVPEKGKRLVPVRKEYAGDRQSSAAVKPTSSDDEEGGEEGGFKALNVVLKADVLGSLEAIVGTLEKMVTPEVGVKVIGRGLGNITDGDIMAAEASGGVVAGFNVLATRDAEILAKDKKIDILTYKIIYELFDEVKRRLQLMLPVEVTRTDLGKLEVLAQFRSDKTGQVVGGRVIEGYLVSGANTVIYRGDQPIGEGKLVQIQSGKADVKEIHQGQECGIKIACRTPIEPGDVVRVFTEDRKERTLNLPR
ncbi:translation initiation factor IF-2 [Candidatus Uhrbacteria bacterium]|nr:translation initiation factor IF-2 [Candidatus Uhrbacteria bacterium]